MRDKALMEETLRLIQANGGRAQFGSRPCKTFGWRAGDAPLNGQIVQDMIADGWLIQQAWLVEVPVQVGATVIAGGGGARASADSQEGRAIPDTEAKPVETVLAGLAGDVYRLLEDARAEGAESAAVALNYVHELICAERWKNLGKSSPREMPKRPFSKTADYMLAAADWRLAVARLETPLGFEAWRAINRPL